MNPGGPMLTVAILAALLDTFGLYHPWGLVIGVALGWLIGWAISKRTDRTPERSAR